MADRTEKIRVGVIGATGMVGQNYLRLLQNHPWFQVTHVAASPRSAGKTYSEAVAGRWLMNEEIPADVATLVVGNANHVDEAKGRCALIFSAVELEKQASVLKKLKQFCKILQITNQYKLFLRQPIKTGDCVKECQLDARLH